MMRLSILACVSLSVLAAIASAACSPANVVRMSLDTPQTDFIRATSVALSPVVVRTLDSLGGFITTGVVTVNVRAPTGVTMTLTSASSQTTSGGMATFTGITLTSPPKGSNFIEFDLVCSGVTVRTERLEVYISSGDGTQVKFFTAPENSVTNFGTFPITPQMAYFDNTNNVADMMDTFSAWTLLTNDTQLNAIIAGNVITPSIASGPIVNFDSLRFNMQPGQYEGRVFTLFLASIGSNVGSSGITFPASIVMRVARCRSDYGIGPGNEGSSNDNLIVKAPGGSATSVNFLVQGWGTFLSSAPGACKFRNALVMYYYQDVCNIACELSAAVGTSGTLAISMDGIAFLELGHVAVVGPLAYLKPSQDYIVLYRQQLTYTTVNFAAVDAAGRWLGDLVPNGYTMSCTAKSAYTKQKRITTSFLDTYTGSMRVPSTTPLITRGNASVDFVFGNYLEPDQHVFCCNASGLIRNTSCLTIEIKEDCTSPPIISSVTAAGCTKDPVTGDLTECITSGAKDIIIDGTNFGYSGTQVRVGPRYCASVEHFKNSPGRRLVAKGCQGTGTNHSILILRPAAKVYALWDKRFNYAKTPVITSIQGCLDFYPSTANCMTSGNNTVMITGQNFGTSGAKVHFYYYDPPGAVVRITAATTWHISGQADTKINATGFPGQGSRFAVAVETAGGELGKETEVTMSFVASLIVPCPKIAGVQCNSKGTCNTAVGSCTCLADGTNGFWAGTACDRCKSGYYGAGCTFECPGFASNPCSGASQGTCSEGLSGTGVCTCAPGYGGTSCQFVCPGGVAAPCSNHGACIQAVNPPTCACDATVGTGYWSGATCAACDALFVGTGCTQQCPTSPATPLVPCTGHGTCASTASGAACICNAAYCGADCSLTGASCGTCPPGQWGAGCVNFCPGYASGGASVCSNHGTCSVGTAGTGVCFCDTTYAGLSCQNQCQSNISGVACSGAGTCDTVSATCACQSGYAGLGCSLTCPGRGSSTGLCSGHGSCSALDGTCSCARGYTNFDCSLPCPGGLSSPCSNHGACLTNNTCRCDFNTTSGFWTGAECATCGNGWYGPNCNATCPNGANGQMCAGHGSCTQEVKCSCIDNSVQGYWDGELCDRCKPNYWGPQCRKQCPGGACNACSGNGVCSDGLLGAGLCTCFANSSNGFWRGDKCDSCDVAYWGLTCASACPRGGLLNTVCSSHGTCTDGIRGDGKCTCIAHATLGYWGGTACAQCLAGYYGPNCTNVCPGSNGKGSTCSGHGTCSDGFSGTGVCTCSATWGLADCSSGCPQTSTNVYCSGNGVCLDGASRNGTCQCHQSDSYGYWSTETCGSCLYGYYGTSCIQRCPRAYAQICAGHGTCDSGTNNTGRCTCDSGWSGQDCARPCDGGSSSPCSNHGSCHQTYGTCTCDSSAAYGYWAGRNCSRCSALYNSSDCTVKCPATTTNPTAPCDGHGSCFEGICTCNAGYCGDKCELNGNDCLNECPEGYWGAECTDMCPGQLNNWCFGHGACSQGLKGTGACSCYGGYWGKDCSNECPGGVATVCSGHGNCDQQSGTCSCRNGWATEDCSIECPGGEANVCSGNGGCLPTTGTCECTQGYAGKACQYLCPGGALHPCNDHGTCGAVSGNCTCHADSTKGYWNSTACDQCSAGYYGNNTCTKKCVNGYTNGTTCYCREGWSGEDCSVPCPGVGSVLGVCSGHGSCLWGHVYTTGQCVCNGNYFTSDCSVSCTPAMCKAQPHYLVNGQCHNQTGKCTCVQNATNGYWDDTSTRCTTCKLFFWGPQCTQRCPCLERGGCDKSTGACNCFDSDADGHFAGVACERCKTGYLGAECKGKDVIITRQKPCSSIAIVKATSEFTLLDRDYGLVITGGRPLIFCNLTTRTLLGKYEFRGRVIAGHIHDSNNYILTLADLDNATDPFAQKKIRIRRERRPTFVIQSEGAVYSVNSSRISNSGVTMRLTRQFNAQGTDDAVDTFTAEDVSPSAISHRDGSTARQLMTVVTFLEPTLIATIPMSSTEYLTVMSNGIVTRTVGLDVVGQYNFGGFFRQVMAADVTTTLLITPSLLFLGGVANNTDSFQVITVALPLSSSNTIQVLTSTVLAKSTYCSTTTRCRAVARLVCDGTYVVLAMLTADGAGVMRFRYTQLFDATYRVESNAILSRYDGSTVVNVTAMLLDPLSSAGFVAMNLQSPDSTEPSTIYKFDLLDLQVYGSVRFQKVVNNYEIVTSLSKDDVARILFATVPLELQINVVPLNLYAVTKVYPHIADTVGGTVVTIEGEGFINDEFLRCDFNGTIVPATYISSREALCVAPVGGDERCEGVPLEITVKAAQYTKNNVLLRRVSSPRISKVYAKRRQAENTDNSYGNTTGGEVVMLEGFGFQDSPFLACRFSSSSETTYARYADRDYAYSGGVQGVRYNNARFINATNMECDQPVFSSPTKDTATVEVTLDGTVYSDSRQVYEAVGTPMGLSTFRSPGVGSWVKDDAVVLGSQDRVSLPDITVFVVDSANQRLRNLDSQQRRISMQLTNFSKQVLTNSNFSNCDYPPGEQGNPVFHTTGVTSTVTTSGRATFSGMYFLRPPAGTFGLTFTDETTGWTYTHLFTITVGAAYRLRMCQEPPRTLNNNLRQLTDAVKLYVEDVSGNQLPAANLVGIRVEASYLRQRTETLAVAQSDRDANRKTGVPINVKRETYVETRMAELQDDFLKFDGLEMTGLYGVTYNINFTAPNLLNITSRGITVEWCVNRTAEVLANPGTIMYFAKLGTSECFVCPEAGWCDGTDRVIIAKNNYWRPSDDSYKFYSCETEDRSSDSCVKPYGTCKQGYEGPRCSVCNDGWGHQGDYCMKCAGESEVIGYMIFLVCITLLFVAILVYTSLTSDLSETLPIVIKIGINHFQVSSRVNEIIVGLPTVLKGIFDFQLQISELIRFDIVSTECAPFKLTIYGKFYLVMAIPFCIMCAFGAGLVCLALYRKLSGNYIKYEKVVVKDNNTRTRRDRVMTTIAVFISKLRAAAAAHHGDMDRDDMRKQYYTCVQYFSAAAVIILCLVYPSMLQWCVTMWDCDTLAFGDADTYHEISYLRVDRRIICTDASHKIVQVISIIAAAVYGVVVPCLTIILVYLHWKEYGRVHARHLYAFVTAGYDVSTWFWEAAVMLRKAAIVFIIIFVKDNVLRTYLGMWTMTLALGAHGWFQPYDPRRPSLYYLEGLGITTIVVTLNLALLFQFDYFKEGNDAFVALEIFLVVINAITLVVFGIMIIYNIGVRVRNFIVRRRAHQEVAARLAEKKAEAGEAYTESETPPSTHDDFNGVDRRVVQREGILGAIRRASKSHLGLQQDSLNDAANAKKFDVRTIPKNDDETPFERLQRLEAERRKQMQRESHAQNQAELEKELEELREHMLRAQALAAAEEAVIARFPEVAEMRRKHEEELYRLMDEIRKERGDFTVGAGAGGAARGPNPKNESDQPSPAFGKEVSNDGGSVTARGSSEEEGFEMNFDDE
jgi:hypothetical protein